QGPLLVGRVVQADLVDDRAGERQDAHGLPGEAGRLVGAELELQKRGEGVGGGPRLLPVQRQDVAVHVRREGVPDDLDDEAGVDLAVEVAEQGRDLVLGAAAEAAAQAGHQVDEDAAALAAQADVAGAAKVEHGLDEAAAQLLLQQSAVV